jgi:hypothetical protein
MDTVCYVQTDRPKLLNPSALDVSSVKTASMGVRNCAVGKKKQRMSRSLSDGQDPASVDIAQTLMFIHFVLHISMTECGQ